MTDSKELTAQEGVSLDTFGVLQQRTKDLDKLYRSILQEGTDYGNVPGTNKPTLLKPGAELLRLWTKLIPDFNVTGGREEDGHYSYQVMCVLTHEEDFAGSGVGYCTTRESKYAYRWVWPRDVPPEIDKSILKTKQIKSKKDGQTYTQYRMENDNVADQANTALKMAKKRAFVDAILTITGASRIFTQDIEDLADHDAEEISDDSKSAPKPKAKGKVFEKTTKGQEMISLDRSDAAKEACKDIPDEVMTELLNDRLIGIVVSAKRDLINQAISGLSNDQCGRLSALVQQYQVKQAKENLQSGGA